MTLETEDEQVEAIKKWWKENGKSLIVGVVLGLGGLYGWQAYKSQIATSEATASGSFEQYKAALETGQADVANGHKQLLQKEYPESVYTFYARLIEAGKAARDGKTAQAIRVLRLAVAKAPDPALSDIAEMRLARLHFASGQADQASALLAKIEGQGLTMEIERLRGDIALAKGDKDAARAAYEKALAADNGTMKELLEMQLSDLGVLSEG